MAKGRWRKAWDIYRHIGSLRGLLQWLGLWGYVAVAGSTLISIIANTVQTVNSLPLVLRAAVFLSVFLSLSFLFIQVAIFVRALEIAEEMENQQVANSRASSDGPEVAVDYFYEERNRDPISSETPLVVKNLSTTSAAYNIEVLPLEIEGLICNFDPSLIGNLGPQSAVNVSADSRHGSILLRKSLPNFLYQSSYKDTSTEELFAIKRFPLRLRYTNAGGTTRYETTCEVCFRPWKRITKIEVTQRRTV